MASAGSIYIDLLLNDSKFVDGLKRGGKGVKEFGVAVTKSAEIAATALAAVGTAASALAIKQAAVIDEMAKQARSLGIANEAYQALALVSKEAGIEQDALANFVGKGQKAIINS